MANSISAALRSKSWSSLVADIVLAGLVAGPLAAPFLAAAPLPILPQIADIIYTMGQAVCPQPALGPMLWPPHLMSVCTRCYGTVLGLAVTRWLYAQNQGRSRYWLDRYGLWGFVAAFITCLFYPLELALQGFGGWGVNNGVMAIFGLIAGLGLGSYVMPILHPGAIRTGPLGQLPNRQY
ncbi:MAG: DUF2085 domain-containing protein [Leptolyngbyaceae cyanobacterium SM1_1_3]|nr:DUF2085 domain-containing protein [Leptolyngbyaceae cyanobacterium SM1_1_3]NJN01469.1 DUF2085 domain-containing protein [Leptolyngbyaceae cyanobacterium RM1_1_2]NJO10779.1 DUF2085 domain-containing protein [Leptolyngbyaceae cyanobacterium SL_1_1]